MIWPLPRLAVGWDQLCVWEGVSFGTGQVGRQNLLFDGINWSDLILTIAELWKGGTVFHLVRHERD